MSFRKITNHQEYSELVEQFLTARESLKNSVRQNKLGLTESEYQQTQIQQPTISAIEKLGEQIQIQQQPTVTAIQKLTEKLTEKKQENVNNAEPSGAKAIPSGAKAKANGRAKAKAKAEIGEEADEEFDAATEKEKISSYLNRVTSKRFKRGAMTVDSNNLLGGIPIKLDFEHGIARVGNREATLTLPLVELLYGPSTAIDTRNYNSDTVIDYDLLTSHINKQQLGRSSKYQLILNDKERLRREENRRERERQQMAIQMGMPSKMEREREQNLQKQLFMQSLQKSKQSLKERQQTAVQSVQEGFGHTLIPQDVGQAANRLNLLCGSVAAGNNNSRSKNEISALCDHLYKQKVLSKP